MENVHKEPIKFVHNALKDRQSVDYEIYGMMGIPQKFLDKRNGVDSNKRPRLDPTAAPTHSPSILGAVPRAPQGAFLATPGTVPLGMPPRPPTMTGYLPARPALQTYGIPQAAWPRPPPPPPLPIHMQRQQNPYLPMWQPPPPQPPQPAFTPRPPPPRPGQWHGVSGAVPSTANIPVPAPPARAGPHVVLVYKDENISMEEKRAMLPKYATPNSALDMKDKLSRLDQAIGDRLKFLNR